MMRSAVLVWVVAMAGCSSLFGLEVPPNVDRDGDNRRDREDNCPSMPNPDQSDFDRDGTGDACDECVDGGDVDLDADGLLDGCDGCVSNGSDVDKDGIPDNCDGCLESGDDVDGDNVDDACDSCVGKGQDIDGDQIDDSCDDCINTYVDADIDGIDDGCDTCIAAGVDADADGVDDACDPCLAGPQHDEDGDTLMDACDNCPAVPNVNQVDGVPGVSAADGVGEACDADAAANVQAFDPFTTQMSAWFVQGAGWLLQADAMHYTGGAKSFRMLGLAQTWFELRTTAVIDGPATGFSSSGFSIFAATEQVQPASTRIECHVNTESSFGTTLTVAVTLRVYSGATLVTEVDEGKGVDPSMPIELILDFDEKSDTVTCRSPDVKQFAALSPIPAGGVYYPGISAQNSAVHFNYFNVVHR
jgi:hypothetical protein